MYRQATRAKSLDALRGLLPAASLSNIGIYGTGQSYEQLLLRMRAHPLPEARHYADMMLDELRKVIPSFLQRVDVPARGGEWSDYLASTRDRTARARGAPVAASSAPARHRRRRRGDGDGRRPRSRSSTSIPTGRRRSWSRPVSRTWAAASGRRPAGCANSATRTGSRCWRRTSATGATVGIDPGRAFERTDYRFELVTDYGAFRDLQRHRMLTMEWQRLGISLGYDMPELVADAGLGERYDEAIGRAEELYRSLGAGLPRASVLRRRAGPPHPLRHAVQRPRGDAPH